MMVNDKAQNQQQPQVVVNGNEPDQSGEENRPYPSPPRPSSSIVVISPTNQVLLLQRVKTTTSFASAYVFPGGNLSAYHDGHNLPPQTSEEFHQDSLEYRLAAIRETFEESGLLLARSSNGRSTDISHAEMEEGRRLVHGNEIPFTEWLAQKGLSADVKGLIPFTRWISPTYVWRRFTTQMYLYFLPLHAEGHSSSMPSATPLSKAHSGEEEGNAVRIPIPTTDGGLEISNAKFLPARQWCRLAQEGSIVLFPPQFFLLHFVARFLEPEKVGENASVQEKESSRKELMAQLVDPQVVDEYADVLELQARRKELIAFVKGNEGGNDAPWMDKCISPMRLGGVGKTKDGREIMFLHDPGYELQGMNRGGVERFCILFDLQKDGTRGLEVVSRAEAVRKGVKL